MAFKIRRTGFKLFSHNRQNLVLKFKTAPPTYTGRKRKAETQQTLDINQSEITSEP